jgi:hypothetical protein
VHPAATGTDGHLAQCFVYIDLNMVRDFAEAQRGGVEESLEGGIISRDQKWAESVAVGSQQFVKATKNKLGFKAKGREVIGGNGSFEPSESPAPYRGIYGHENAFLRPRSSIFGMIIIENRQLGRPPEGVCFLGDLGEYLAFSNK